MHRVKMEDWICREEGLSQLTRPILKDLQLNKLNHLLNNMSRQGRIPKDLPDHLDSLSGLQSLPFTREQDLRSHPGSYLACSQAQIHRIISENTSGTTGSAKRVFYSQQDLRHTVNFFASGISEMLSSGEKCLIGFPFSGPFGLGDLISQAVRQLGAIPIKADFGEGYQSVLDILSAEQPETYIGFPVPLLSLFRLQGSHLSIQRALLSGDSCPGSVLQSLPIPCFPHYGSRETVLGGAVTCPAHQGMHLRENHIIAEIVDAQGHVLPDGQWGELVVTTIGMEAMPLLRYRTGDLTRILPGTCPCGGITCRLDSVSRMETGPVSIKKLDECLFSIPWIIDYRASTQNGTIFLEIHFLSEGSEQEILESVRAVYPELTLKIILQKASAADRPVYGGKRSILKREG